MFAGASPVRVKLEFAVDPDRLAEAKAFIEMMLQRGKIVASICGGNAVLARTGTLDGKRAARCPAIRHDFIAESTANWTNSKVEVDGRIVTARDTTSSPDFVKALLDVYWQRK